MICKEGSIDVISIGNNSGNGSGGGNTSNNSANSQQMHHGGASTNGHNTLQHRRKSQLITFSASSCDIKNSLSHEIIMVNNNANSNANNGSNQNGINHNHRGSIVGSIGSNTQIHNNTRLSFAEEDIMIIPQNGQHQQQVQHQQQIHIQHQQNGSLSGSGTGSGSESVGVGHNHELEDDVFRRHSLEVDEEAQEALYNEEYGTHIETKSNNANDDSGGGSYEDSHALHSSLGGSNRNSLEKDDDDIDVDVISTDVSCYDQLLGSSCNTRNDDDEIATIVGDGENYTKLSKHGLKTSLNGGVVGGCSYGVVNSGSGGGVGENGGIIYANPFMGL